MTELRERLQAALGDAYKVGEELTGGGMSRVFVADDVELDRKVVVKLLPPDLAAGLNVERFRREIQLAARLQHPHIVPLLHAGANGGLLYYTMPYISGDSLRGRLARSGELPIGDAVRILIEVADALEAAHADGVVHRDIKPENILLARNHALVTDFGVSKALSSATGETNLTSLGVALGTPAYMSPEQAAADPNVDHRTDIYALGVLAYELLTGRPPFTGATPQQVLAAQVTEAPQPISAARPSIPAPLAAVIMRCLEKRPADRWQSAEELRVQLEMAASPSGSNQPVAGALPPAAAAAGGPSSRRYLFAGGAAAVLALALLASTYLRAEGKAFSLEETRQLTNDPGGEVVPALSPDGRLLAYFSERADSIVVRQVSGGKPVSIASGSQPAWSPNGSEIAFAGENGVYVVPSLGGTPRRIVAEAEWPAWSPDGKSLAFVTYDGWVSVSDVDGRNARKLHRTSQPHLISWAPDGSRLAFVSENAEWISTGNLAPSSIVVVRADGKQPTVVTTATHLNTSPRWSADGSGIFYISSIGGGRDIYFRRIARDGKPAGEAQRLTTGLALHSITSSADGSVMAYATATATVGVWSLPIPATGAVSVGTARQLTFANERIEAMSISPDEKWMAFDSDRAGNQDVWKMPLAGGDAEQLTRDPADDFNPAWSPDGKEISFHSWRSGSRDSYVISADGSNERLLVGGPKHEFAGRWSPDGKSLAILVLDGPASGGLYVISRDGGAPRQLIRNDGAPRPFWSPDGRWIAYAGRSGSISIVPAAGGEPVEVYPRGRELGGWTSDSRGLYARMENDNGAETISVIDIATKQARPLVLFDRPDRPVYRPEFVAHGGQLYFTIGKHEADIWVVKLRTQ